MGEKTDGQTSGRSMTSIKKSRCLTCPKVNGNSDVMANAEAVQHQDRYPDHHVQLVPDEELKSDPRAPRRLAPAILIPLGIMQATGAVERLSHKLFDSYLAARTTYAPDEYDVIWPAVPDSEGFYSVPE